MPSDRILPAQTPPGFVKITGVPNTAESKPFFADVSVAVSRCAGDPRCVGVSAQRLFYGAVGTPATTVGRSGENESLVREKKKRD